MTNSFDIFITSYLRTQSKSMTMVSFHLPSASNGGCNEGGPLSPILFNLALEPLLLTINQDSAMLCYRFRNGGSDYYGKTLDDIDNVCALIVNTSDYVRL